MMYESLTVTIPLEFYNELVIFRARAELMEEQKQQQEAELKAWRETHKEE